MSAFNDARCPKCGTHIGWRGSVLDRPLCPKCGHQIPMDILKADEEAIAKVRAEIVAELKAKRQNRPTV